MSVAILSDLLTEIVIPLAALIGIAFALYEWHLVSKVKLLAGPRAAMNPEDDVSITSCIDFQNEISRGVATFLHTEYRIVGTFIVVFAAVIFVSLGSVSGFSRYQGTCTYNKDNNWKPELADSFFTALSFLLGAFTSLVSGFICIKVATYANIRTTLEARHGIGKAFVTAIRSGSVIGFLQASNGLLVLFMAIKLFKLFYGDDWEGLFQTITGYGLGGCTVALFNRIGGGIFAKAADVSADLVKYAQDRVLTDDDPRNQAVIADNVGDNVGGLAGMVSDLFGSYAEATCAALVVGSVSSFGINNELTPMLYPLLISSMGIIVSLVTTIFTTSLFKIRGEGDIGPAMRKQFVISTVLMTVGIAIVSWIALPSTFSVFSFGIQKEVRKWELFYCAGTGLWCGLVIGFNTEYFTSNEYDPVQYVAQYGKSGGAACNIILGLALGYQSVIVPICAIAVTACVSFHYAAIYGVAIASLGMLSILATGVTIDAYGPISDNAGGIAALARASVTIRDRIFALDSAGNRSAVGKGFAISSAALVSLALLGVFVSRVAVSNVHDLAPKVSVGLIFGAMLPYWFSSMTLKSIGQVALDMADLIDSLLQKDRGLMARTSRPDYADCVNIITADTFKKIILPSALVLLTPLVVGTLFGVEVLSGVLAGSLVSGVQVAISASNSGGAWDSAKKYIEFKALGQVSVLGPRRGPAHNAAVIGDTIGDPLKDTSGPALNVLMKLMTIESLVFAPFFLAYGGIFFKTEMMASTEVSLC